MPAFRSFRILCAVLGAVGLMATFRSKELQWHLLWYTPLSIVGAYFFSLRHLFALKQRLDDIQDENITNLDRLQERIAEEVQKYNESVGEDEQLK